MLFGAALPTPILHLILLIRIGFFPSLLLLSFFSNFFQFLFLSFPLLFLHMQAHRNTTRLLKIVSPLSRWVIRATGEKRRKHVSSLFGRWLLCGWQHWTAAHLQKHAQSRCSSHAITLHQQFNKMIPIYLPILLLVAVSV